MVKKKKIERGGERKTAKREEVQVRVSALTGEKPLRKVPLNAVKLLTRNYMDVLSVRKKTELQAALGMSYHYLFQADATFWKITMRYK